MKNRAVQVGFFVALLAAGFTGAGEPPKDDYFDSDGVRIRYVEAGSGEAVVLVHGFAGNLDQMWMASGVFDALARDFHVVAFDARGHGRSDKPHEQERYGADMVQDVVRLLDHLGIRKAHLVGYSMGACIVGKFATIHPDRVSSVVFGGNGPRLWTAEHERLALEQGKGLRPLILATASRDRPPPSDDEIEKMSALVLAKNDPAALAAVQRGNHEQRVAPGELTALAMPLLAVIGSEDPLKDVVMEFKRLNPRLEVIEIEGAGHLGAGRRPEFAAAVGAFLREHATPPRDATAEAQSAASP